MTSSPTHSSLSAFNKGSLNNNMESHSSYADKVDSESDILIDSYGAGYNDTINNSQTSQRTFNRMSETQNFSLTKLIENKPQPIRKFITECLYKTNSEDFNKGDGEYDSMSSAQSFKALNNMILTLNKMSCSDFEKHAIHQTGNDLDNTVQDLQKTTNHLNASEADSPIYNYGRKGKEYLDQTREHFVTLKNIIGDCSKKS